MILEHNKDDTLPSAPISRSLLPFQRVQHFTRCRIRSLPSVLRLESALIMDPSLTDLVKTFDFRIWDTFASFPLARIAALITTFTNLESLTLLDYPEKKLPAFPQAELATILLDGSIQFSRLTSIAFRLPSKWLDGYGYNPEHYLFLDRFPCLTSLGITIDHLDSRLNFEPPHFDTVPFIFSRITSLSLAGGLLLNTEATAQFTTLFPNLTSFQCRSTSLGDASLSDYTKIVQLLPDNLESLALLPSPVVNLDTPGASTIFPCDTSFPRFHSLKTLTLGCRTFSNDVLSYLKRLPSLETLIYSEEAFPELDDLQDRDSLPPSLKTIVMNQIKSGKIGWRMDGPYVELPSNAQGRHALGPGWSWPQFWRYSRFFLIDELSETIQILQDFGIAVEGSAVKALEVQVAATLQLKYCTTARAIGTGDFAELKKAYGEEWTKAAKAERRRRKKAWDLIKKEKAESRKKGKAKTERGVSKSGKGGKKSK